MAAHILRCSTEVLARLATFLSGNTLQDQALQNDDSDSDQEHHYARPSQLLTAMLLQEARNRGLVAVYPKTHHHHHRTIALRTSEC